MKLKPLCRSKVLFWQLWSVTQLSGLITDLYYWYWRMKWGDQTAVHSWRLSPTSPPHVALMSAFGGPPCSEHLHSVGVYSPLARLPYRAVILHLADAAQRLPSFPQAGLQTAELLVRLVEDFELSAAPAPPDTQAPLHVFLMKATYNCVLCH